MGAFCLNELDIELQPSASFYVHFMDDIVVLPLSRRMLRKAIKLVNTVLEALRLEKHPDKSFVEGLERVSNFSVYH
jgi:hypothetical protein